MIWTWGYPETLYGRSCRKSFWPEPYISVCTATNVRKPEAILNAVEDGTIPLERINESVRRIIKLKLKYELTDVPVNPDELYKVVGIEEHRAVADKAWGRN